MDAVTGAYMGKGTGAPERRATYSPFPVGGLWSQCQPTDHLGQVIVGNNQRSSAQGDTRPSEMGWPGMPSF